MTVFIGLLLNLCEQTLAEINIFLILSNIFIDMNNQCMNINSGDHYIKSFVLQFMLGFMDDFFTMIVPRMHCDCQNSLFVVTIVEMNRHILDVCVSRQFCSLFIVHEVFKRCLKCLQNII